MKSKEEIEVEQRKENSIRLHQAIDKCDIAEVKQILKTGNVDVEFKYLHFSNMSANILPLHRIIINCLIGRVFEEDALKMLKLLIVADVNINSIEDGKTALTWAINEKNPKMLLIDCLLEAGADVNLSKEGFSTPLGAAKRNMDVVEKLLAHGADMHQKYYDKTILDMQKDYINNPTFYIVFTDREFSGIDVRKITYDLYLKADFVDSLFYRENKDVVKEKFKQAFTIDNFTDRSNFMIDRFKSLCAIKDSETTNQESTSFMSHLNKVIAYEFLPEKLKNGLQDILKDYEEIIDNVEGFALQDAYNIYAQKNEIKQVTAPISFKQIQDILINSRLEDEEIFQSILNFCNSHSIYQEHSYLNHESSSDEITKLMHKIVDCAEKIKELFAKYKGVFCNDVLEQAIDNYDIQYQSQELSGDINQLLSSENGNI